jgi:hypothetical protein
MGTRIPLPGSGGEALQRGVEQGSNMFQQFMGHGINLGRMHQQGQQFEKTHQLHEKQLEQAMQQHMQNLALHQQQEKRLQEAAQMAAKLHPYQIENLKAGIAQHQAKTQQLQKNQSLLEQLLNGGGFGQQSGIPMQDMTQQQPAEPFSMGEGMQPGFNAFGGQNMQPPAPPPMETVKNGFSNLTGPQAAFVKKQTGFDPFAETPQDKQAREMQSFREKEDYKAEKKKKDMTEVTPATRNEAQRIITATNSIVPLLNDLISMDIPNQNFALLSPNDQAKYKRKSFLAADKLMTISKLPRIQESLHGSLELLRMGNFEDPALFKEGLKELRSSILEEAKDQQEILETGKIPKVSLNFSESTVGTGEGDKKEKMVIVRNKQTGEEKYVSEEEARKMGAIK